MIPGLKEQLVGLINLKKVNKVYNIVNINKDIYVVNNIN